MQILFYYQMFHVELNYIKHFFVSMAAEHSLVSLLTQPKLLIRPTNKKFAPQEMLAILKDQSVTIFCAAPTVLRLLVADPAFDRIEFPSLRRIVTVGEALDETVNLSDFLLAALKWLWVLGRLKLLF